MCTHVWVFMYVYICNNNTEEVIHLTRSFGALGRVGGGRKRGGSGVNIVITYEIKKN